MEIRRVPQTVNFVIQEGRVEITVERLELETNMVKVELPPLLSRLFSAASLQQLKEPYSWRGLILYIPTEQFCLMHDYDAQHTFKLNPPKYVELMQRAKFINMANHNLSAQLRKLLREI